MVILNVRSRRVIMTINEYNKELEVFYLKYFNENKIEDSLTLDKLSVPMLLKLDESYFNPEKPTIIIFGQETKYWGKKDFNTYFHLRDKVDETVKSVMNHYSWQLNNTKRKTRSVLIRTNRKIQNQLTDNYNILWSNIYKYSYDGKRVSKNVTKEHFKTIMKHQKEFMKFELELFQPKGMIFFTGKRLDREIEHNLDAKVKWIENYDAFSSRLDIKSTFNIDEDIKVLRSYYPQYLSRKKKLDSVVEYSKELFLKKT